MASAIEHARSSIDLAETSVFGGARHRHPDLEVSVLPESFVFAISRAIEDEAQRHAVDGVVVGRFQDDRAWRRAAARWRRLADQSLLTVVLADFDALEEVGGVWQVPIPSQAATQQEWAVVVEAPGWSACVVARQRDAHEGANRWFDVLWSFDPAVVRDAVTVALALDQRVQDRASLLLDLPPRALDPCRLQLGGMLTNRILQNLLHAARRGAPSGSRASGSRRSTMGARPTEVQ